MKKIILFAFALLTCASMAQAADKSTAKHYDSRARQEASPNDVNAFVYQWFAAFDHQAPISAFLQHIDPAQVDMQYPDFPIRQIRDFERWYQGVVDNVQWNSHELRNVRVTGEQAAGFDVSLDVCWRASLYDGSKAQMLVHQDWSLKVAKKGRLMFKKMRASVVGDC